MTSSSRIDWGSSNEKKATMTLCCLVICILLRLPEAIAFDFYSDEAVLIHPNEVHIGKTGIAMPLEKILLARKNSEYCAIKFTKFWSENTSEVGSIFVASGSDEYANYELYYQRDKTGNFSNKNVQFKKDVLSFPKPRGIGRLAFSFGRRDIECGNITLQWSGEGSVHFYKRGQDMGDYGVELSPTKWTDISQVNVFDPRLTWYRYDENRKRVNIPIDKLWDEKK